MQTTLLMIAAVLFGQVTDGSSERYPLGSDADTSQNSFQFKTETDTSDATRRDNFATESTAEPATTPMTEAKPLPNSSTTASVSTPTQLLDTLAKRTTTGQLTGKPLSLADALATARSRGEQSQRVQLYWRLATAVMQHDLAQRELTELSTLSQGIQQPSSAWSEVHGVMQSTLQAKLQTARALQYQLQSKLGSSSETLLPIPSDLPLSGAYETRYDELFASRQVPEATALHELLKLEYATLRRQAGSVSSSRQWLKTVSETRSTQSDGNELLQAYQSFASSRRLFLQAVNDYNSHIVRYTELATPGEVGTRRLVAMLVKSEALQWNRDGIRRTSAEEPAGQGSTGGQPPRTYADPNTRPLPNNERSSEHSILVK